MGRKRALPGCPAQQRDPKMGTTSNPCRTLTSQRNIIGRLLDNVHASLPQKDGSKLTGSSMRNLRADVSHFADFFKGKRLKNITVQDVGTWYNSPHPEGPWSFYGSCQVLRSLFKAASTPGKDGTKPIIGKSPFVFPVAQPPASERLKQRPVSPAEARKLAQAMPDTTRLSIWLALLVGGLRIGEVCALQVEDIDLDSKILYVRHSVSRGPYDRGPCRLGTTKTASSMRVVPIPDNMIEPISTHIQQFCGSRGMLFPAARARILSPTTLSQQFRKARLVIDRTDITFHSLRATHATMVMIKGGTLREAMEELGHTSEKIALKHYQRIVPSHRKKVVNDIAVTYLPLEDTQAIYAEIQRSQAQINQLNQHIADLQALLA